MEIDDDDRRLPPQGLDLDVRPPEGAVDGLHEDPALEVEHGDLDAAAVLEDVAAAAGVARRVVGGAEEARLALEVGQGLLLVPDVVARGQDVDLEEQVPADLLGDADAPGGVLAVGDDDRRRVFPDELGQEPLQGPPAGMADDVPEEEDPGLIGHIPPPSSPG